jgi:hypothetical protein
LTWRIAQLPGFVAADAAEMTVDLIALQTAAMRKGVVNEAAYAEVYDRVFGQHDDITDWLKAPPAAVAHGLYEMVRAVGLFVLLDDGTALAHLENQATWRTRLPPVPIARPGPIYTPSRRQQLDNRRAFEALVHRAAAITFSERLPSLPIGPADAAEQLRRQTIRVFGPVIDEAGAANDGTLRTLRRQQATCLQLIAQRANSPREEALLLLSGEMPSLVCAHYAYREARQAQRIRDANPTAHPNFMAPQLTIPEWP